MFENIPMLDTPYADTIEKAHTLYFDYLMGLVDAKPEDLCPGNQYSYLCKRLHEKEFYWSIETDANRAADGKHLRKLWLQMMQEAGYEYPEDSLDGPCTVFEMLVGLCKRIADDILWDPDNVTQDVRSCWFYIILRNLGLEGCTDDAITVENSELINKAVRTALDRMYDSKGNGGFFPLAHSRKDQRKVEIWYQLNQYMAEHRGEKWMYLDY